jgi:transposase InsO family protein
MYMPYSNNPQLPRVRMEAVLLVRSGWSQVRVGRHLGYTQGVISRWVKRAPPDGRKVIPTESSRPGHHPRALKKEVVQKIIAVRERRNRCAEVVQQELLNEGIIISLSSVKRTLRRQGLLRQRSPWKRWHFSTPRSITEHAGDLVQVDTIHIQVSKELKLYVYTLIDLYSRFAYAKVVMRINTHQSLRFVREAQRYAPFTFKMIQSDHGPEFSSWFTEQVGALSMAHRHSRVRRSNDNAHIERFNRTLEEECLDKVRPDFYVYQKAIRKYLTYYNGQRLHMGIQLMPPLQKIAETIPRY